MARGKKFKNDNGESKRGHYKRDHDYVDISDVDDNLYEDG
jgi:hypothetical protein